MAWWNTLGLQNSSSPLMEQLTLFHDHTMIIIMLIISVVSYLMYSLLFNKFINRSLLENQTTELIWTIIPAIILLFIAMPSLRLLYLLDETNKPSITVKSVGHQWFWTYEYTDFPSVEFDAYMIPLEEYQLNSFRLLETDNHTMIPVSCQIRLLTTATDVIHAWTVPALGVKADAVPGRLNQMSFSCSRPGMAFGQCSEICGANHSFMPITLEMTPIPMFLNWLETHL